VKEVSVETVNVATETLDILDKFLTELETLCIGLAQEHDEVRFIKFIDNLEILNEAIRNMKYALALGLNQEIELLEADLRSILQDLLSSREKGDSKYVQELLSQHLVQNLREWKSKGIPSIREHCHVYQLSPRTS